MRKVYNWIGKSVQLDGQKWTIGWAKVYNWMGKSVQFSDGKWILESPLLMNTVISNFLGKPHLITL